MDGPADIGQRAIQKIHQLLMIDELWTLRAHRGFIWLARRLAQAIEPSPPVHEP